MITPLGAGRNKYGVPRVQRTSVDSYSSLSYLHRYRFDHLSELQKQKALLCGRAFFLCKKRKITSGWSG